MLQKHEKIELEKAKKEAETANRYKNEFLANISHEIRTPLNGITGLTEILSTTELTAEQKELVGLLKKSSKNLIVLVNNLLDFSKLEANLTSLEKSVFNIHEILKNTIKSFSDAASEKDLTIEFNTGENIPEKVAGDAEALKKIITHLRMGKSIVSGFLG